MTMFGRLDDLQILVGDPPMDFAKCLSGDLVVTFTYTELGGLWRASARFGLRTIPLFLLGMNVPGGLHYLSWEPPPNTQNLWREGAPVEIKVGDDTIFQGRVLSISSPQDEPKYPGDWQIELECGDALYWSNYSGRDLGGWLNQVNENLEWDIQIGPYGINIKPPDDYSRKISIQKSVEHICQVCGLSFSGTIPGFTFTTLLNRDQEGLLSGLIGPLVYQNSRHVLYCSGGQVFSVLEDLDQPPHLNISLADTLEMTPNPDPEPLVEKLEIFCNFLQPTPTYRHFEETPDEGQGFRTYYVDGRINGEGFVEEGAWLFSGSFESIYQTVSTEYRRGKSLVPFWADNDAANSTYYYKVVTRKHVDLEGRVFKVVREAFGHAIMHWRANKENLLYIPHLSFPTTPWYKETTEIIFDNNGYVAEERTKREEYLSELTAPRFYYGFQDLPVTNYGTQQFPFRIYGPVVTDRELRRVYYDDQNKSWVILDARYDFATACWITDPPKLSDRPVEPERTKRPSKTTSLLNVVHSWEDVPVELVSVVDLAPSDPNPAVEDRKKVQVEFCVTQENLNTLAQQYARILRGKRQQWTIDLPWRLDLWETLKHPCRIVRIAPDAHGRDSRFFIIESKALFELRRSVIRVVGLRL